MEKKVISETTFNINITNDSINVKRQNVKAKERKWVDISEIYLMNTDITPFDVDIWLVLIGKKNRCIVPFDTKSYDEIYEVISRYDGFNFDNVNKSMSCTGSKFFPLWKK